ncbi:magnesium transporter [Pedosphaera parvula]|uniref:CBS domain containing protein n=1 Tax=Pedosphaera parvula (strain Ellin514) TaxID=320771 RepID=B9XG75_PEDPL|nr:magnesium transporter [Pedosphaera parvula]EEF61237.1 CBS domain containing protein [Pedosphaera parvula Ellin514]
MTREEAHLEEPILLHVRRDFPLLKQQQTIQAALDTIRQEGIGEKIIYFYVVDEHGRLQGVLPTRRLLTSPAEKRISDLMITRIIAIPSTATLLEACELFALHKFLAFPVVDAERHVVGMVDINLFTEEVLDMPEPKEGDDLFEALGFHIWEIRGASPFKAYRFRFPWLLTTIASGTVCALIAGAYEATLAQSLILAFFLTLVLGLGESVSIQSMSLTIQALRVTQPTLRWYLKTLKREFQTALMIGLSCGLVVGLIVWIWRRDAMASLAIGTSILLSLFMASLLGLSVPSLLHACKLDPKIAAGPITLAITDMLTLLFYFSLGTWLLLKPLTH